MIYPYEIREERVGNLELKLVGVRHTFNDFELQKEFFSDEINKVDLVFFEDGMGNEFYRALRNQMLREGKEKYYIPDKNGNYALGSEITAGLGGLALLGKALKNNLFNKKELSRAEFLKKSLYFTAGAYLLSNSGGFVEDLTQGLVGPDSSIDNSLPYNTIQDFRNIISASNLIRGEKKDFLERGFILLEIGMLMELVLILEILDY